jgi:hypothetical protein
VDRLNALALAPGSPLACLNALAGDAVETACEKALFGLPASVAAASSYVAAQLSVLSNLVRYRNAGGKGVDDLVTTLRRSLEADRFGFVAHVLALRDACSGESCKTLALLQDSSRVRANLAAGGIGRYLDHYAALWGTGADAVVAEGATAAQPTPRKVVNADFPSAASIPAVSIMNPEPTGPVLPGVAAAAAANPNPSAAGAQQRHGRKAAAAAAPAATISGQSNPPGSPAIEPIWPEPVPAPPSSAQTTPSAPVAAAPIQLNPPNAGGPTRTQ